MTCVIGLEDDGRVYLGGDAAAVEGDAICPIDRPKVFAVGEYLLGYCESFRMGQILEYRLKAPDQKCTDDREHLATVVVDQIRQVLLKGGLEVAAEMPGSLLVGYRGRLYTIESDYAVLRSGTYAAIGVGADLALGSLASTIGPPERRVKHALSVAAKFCTAVTPPFTVINS